MDSQSDDRDRMEDHTGGLQIMYIRIHKLKSHMVGEIKSLNNKHAYNIIS